MMGEVFALEVLLPKDGEISGEGNSYDFGARMYNSRLGRWFSVDPLAAKYPGMSPYSAMGNNPVIFIDPDGREIVIINKNGDRLTYKPMMKIPKDADIYTQDVIMALNYLYNNVEGADDKIEFLVNAEDLTIPIIQSWRNAYDFFSKSISFNNLAAYQIKNGKWHSPAVSLAHELGHAWRYNYIVDRMMKAIYKSKEYMYWDGQMTLFKDEGHDLEELSSATDPDRLETQTAKSLNQGVRDGYTNPIDVEVVGCVTCTTPLDDNKLSEEQRKFETNQKLTILKDKSEEAYNSIKSTIDMIGKGVNRLINSFTGALGSTGNKINSNNTGKTTKSSGQSTPSF